MSRGTRGGRLILFVSCVFVILGSSVLHPAFAQDFDEFPSSTVGEARGTVSRMLRSFEDAVQSAWKGLKVSASRAWDIIVRVAKRLGVFAGKVWGAISRFFVRIGGQFAGALKDAWSAARRAVEDIIGSDEGGRQPAAIIDLFGRDEEGVFQARDDSAGAGDAILPDSQSAGYVQGEKIGEEDADPVARPASDPSSADPDDPPPLRPAPVAKEIKRPPSQKTRSASPEVPTCPFFAGRNPNRRLVISEIAWMGSAAEVGETAAKAANREWIEFYNPTGADVPSSGFLLQDSAGRVVAPLPSGFVRKEGFLVLRRDADYAGALSNAGLWLRLFDADCGLVDEIDARSGWPAGDNAAKKTLERDTVTLNWHKSDLIGGTPGRMNTVGALAADPATPPGAPSAPAVSGSGGPAVTILITEVQIASQSSSRHEFVELYNPNSGNVSLAGWYLQKKTKTGSSFSTFAPASLFEGAVIAPGGYFVIAHPSSGIPAQVFTDYGIADNNTLVLKNPSGVVVDQVGWGEAQECQGQCALNPGAGAALQRRRIGSAYADTDDHRADFVVSACVHPGTYADACLSSFIETAAPQESDQAQRALPLARPLTPVLISEIQVAGQSAGDEFIELYNPNDQEVAIGDYSLQYVSGAATTTKSVAKKNFTDAATIGEHGFFLVGRGPDPQGNDGYQGSSTPDVIHRSFALSSAASGGRVFLVGNQETIDGFEDPDIVDAVFYGGLIPPAGSSIERRASASCLDPGEPSARYLGHGCDTGMTADFVIRPASQPQNAFALPEPRELSFSSFSAAYSLSSGTARLSWQLSDSSIPDALLSMSAVSSTSPIAQVSSTGFYDFAFSDIGREYAFLIEAADPEGLAAFASTTFHVPPFLENAFYYQPSPTEPWVAYLGFSQTFFDLISSSTVATATVSLARGEGRVISEYPVMLEDRIMQIVLPTEFDPGGGALQAVFSVITKSGVPLRFVETSLLLLRSEAFSSLPPTPPESLFLAFDDASSVLTLTFSPSQDPDSPDISINYQASVATGTESAWMAVASGSTRHTVRVYEQGASYACRVRAVDEFGSLSDIREELFIMPAVPLSADTATSVESQPAEALTADAPVESEQVGE